MDIVTIERTDDYFRILLDTKGRFATVRIDADEANFKFCKVIKRSLGENGVPYIVTHDGRTLRYAHPDIKALDTIKLDLRTSEIVEHLRYEQGTLLIVTGGKNTGRVGTLFHQEKHQGGFDIVHIRDAKGKTFATRQQNAFVIGSGKNPVCTLPKGEGLKLSIFEEQQVRAARKNRS